MKALIASTTIALLTVFTPAQDVNEESLTAASSLIETMGVREELAVGFKAAMAPILQPMIQQMGLNGEQVTELNNIFTSWWENDIDQEAIIKEFQSLYAGVFTVEEMKELGMFYSTPVGQKVLLTMPQLTQEGMKIGQSAAEKKQPELMAKMQAFQEKVAKEQAAEAAEGEEDDEPAE